MRAVGIICEYNPLHRGHAYHIAQARERADVVICVMSGNFTQRGEAAILPPVSRAEMAIAAGADLVVELPFPYAAASATYFATAGVRIAQGLLCDALSFGCEHMDEQAIRETAAQIARTERLQSARGEHTGTGSAAAYYAALEGKLLSNDILAVEYVRAIASLCPDMALLPVRRVGSHYTQTEIDSDYPSATALREALARGEDVTAYLPPETKAIFEDAVARYGIADTARLGAVMLARLRVQSGDDTLADLGGGLLAHLENSASKATDYASLCRAAATKRYTNGRIRRALVYLLADVKQADLDAPPAYVRLLAANEKGRAYLAKTRKTRSLPVVTKPRDVKALGERALRAHTLAANADALWSIAAENPIAPTKLAVIPPFMAQ